MILPVTSLCPSRVQAATAPPAASNAACGVLAPSFSYAMRVGFDHWPRGGRVLYSTTSANGFDLPLTRDQIAIAVPCRSNVTDTSSAFGPEMASGLVNGAPG